MLIVFFTVVHVIELHHITDTFISRLKEIVGVENVGPHSKAVKLKCFHY